MSTWQEFRDELAKHSALFAAQPDLAEPYLSVMSAAGGEYSSAVETTMYVLMDAVRRKVQPAGIDAAVNELMKTSRTIDAGVGDERPDPFPYIPKL